MNRPKIEFIFTATSYDKLCFYGCEKFEMGFCVAAQTIFFYNQLSAKRFPIRSAKFTQRQRFEISILARRDVRNVTRFPTTFGSVVSE